MFQTTNARHTAQPIRLCAHLFHSIRRNGTHGTRTTQQKKKTHAQESARKKEKNVRTKIQTIQSRLQVPKCTSTIK